MTPYILQATGGTMLNFGYWNGKTANLGQAQNELCMLVGKFAQLHSAKKYPRHWKWILSASNILEISLQHLGYYVSPC